MQTVQQKDKALVSHIAGKNAHIINALEDNWQYIAVPYGDRRRRPVAWICEHTLQRLLVIGAIVQTGNAYVLSNFEPNKS